MRILLVLSVMVPFSVFAEPSGELLIFHAGSLSVPFEIIKSGFEALYPEVNVLCEASGSVVCARKITELDRECDIMASADYRIIDRMLLDEFASWNVIFATNRMVLAYLPESRYSNEINTDNWHKILQKEDVEWGHSDPDMDPCGYRTLLLLQLAEMCYNEPGLYETLITSRDERNIRPKSVELISLLQSGHLDYAFEYLSVTVQHELEYIDLSDSINLGGPQFADFYELSSIDIAGSEPGQTRTMTGAPIAYGITILDEAPNMEASIAFLEYLFDPCGGLLVLEELGQPPFNPPFLSNAINWDNLPEAVKPLVERSVI